MQILLFLIFVCILKFEYFREIFILTEIFQIIQPYIQNVNIFVIKLILLIFLLILLNYAQLKLGERGYR